MIYQELLGLIGIATVFPALTIGIAVAATIFATFKRQNTFTTILTSNILGMNCYSKSNNSWFRIQFLPLATVKVAINKVKIIVVLMIDWCFSDELLL